MTNNQSFSMSSVLSLHMRCEKLPLLNGTGCVRSDCFAVVYLYNDKTCEYTELGRTETVRNSLDPEWSSKVQVEHIYETGHEVKFEFYYQLTKDGKDLSKQLKIGYIKTELKHIKQAANGKLCLDIVPCESFLESYPELSQAASSENKYCVEDEPKGPPYVGKFTVRGLEIGNDLDLLNFQFRAKSINLKKHKSSKNCEKTVKLYFEIYQYQVVDDSYIKVYVSNPQPYIKKKGVDFGLLSLPLQKLCNTDRDLPLKFKFYIYDSENRGNSSEKDFIGAKEMSINELVDTGKRFKIYNKKCKHKGTILVSCVSVVKRYSYLEFIRCGLDLNLTFAIDYTRSNGEITDAKSNHYILTEDLNQYQYFNEYQQSIASIGKVLQEYSISQAITCLGFGAVLPQPYGNGCVSHRFPLRYDACDNEESENVEEFKDIDEILVQYQKVAEAVEMKGPSSFVPMLSKIFQKARVVHNFGEKKYSVFVILTDGDVDDMSDTKKLIVDNSDLPVSIVICGIGQEDYHENIKILAAHGDRERLCYEAKGQGKVNSKRNIVSYLRIKEFEKGKTPREDLAKAVLSVIPEQITSYYASVNIAPATLKDTNMAHLMSELKGGSARLRGAVHSLVGQAVGDLRDEHAYNDIPNQREVKKAGNVLVKTVKTVARGIRRMSTTGSKLSRVTSLRPRLSISASRTTQTEFETKNTEIKVGAEVVGGEAVIPTFDFTEDKNIL